MKTKLLAVITLALAALFDVTVHANTVTVTSTADSGSGSLRAAISAAAANGTIVFDPSVTGTITLTSGELVIGRNLSILGPGANVLTISGNSASPVFYIAIGATGDIFGLTVANGVANILCSCTIYEGGGIFNEGKLLVDSCTLVGNQAVGLSCTAPNGWGGAVGNDGVLTLNACTFVDNLAAGFSGCDDFGASGLGGAVFNSGVVNMLNCTFQGNSAIGGNGPTVGGYAAGGAIDNSGDDQTKCFISFCTISGNNANGGHGQGLGGGVETDRATIIVGGSIIAGNNVSGGSAPGFTTFGPDVGAASAGQFDSAGYNLIGIIDGSSGWTGSDLTGTQFSPLDPLLGPLADNGGPTKTMALGNGSAAIDTGFSAFVFKDQRGLPRPVLLAGGIRPGDGSDIGAYEAQAVPYRFSITTSNSNSFASLTFASILNATNNLQGRVDLSSGSWSNLGVSIVGNGGTVEAIWSSGLNVPKQFYRVATTVQTGTVHHVDFDSTVDPFYTNGWMSGSNAGLGFGPWTLAVTCTNCPGANGFLIATSTNNGFGTGPGIDVGGGPSNSSIESTNPVVVSPGTSWGLYATSNNLAVAFRAFSNSVPVGATLRVDMDNGFVDASNSVGFVLRNGTSSSNAASYATGARFQFLYAGPGTNNSYRLIDAAGSHTNGVPWTSTGLHLLFRLNTTNTYTLLTIDNASGATNASNGTLAGSGTVDSIALFNNNPGASPENDVFFNSLQLVGP